eukprot:CAMPEP_0197191338 /NCGR_PEP_ID=MMETSP1423-20130617/23213_1 /TAXON_ID=476441 /ORGANISM="Pseudo-nitzschia heimii, Strain UNC1101" /LENGTH=239 /DNA_ID=CAMNT_0042643945 /DNA_START=62 /DNA_END=781 /DNA_ORIENTATION=-
MVLCLITGPSGSGKTSMTLELQKNLLDKPLPSSNKPDGERLASVVVVHQDSYFTKPFLPYKERKDDSYENSSGIDWDRLLADVDFRLREATREKIDDAGIKIVIVEGHLLGDAAAHFRRRFLMCEDVGIVTVLLEGCSRETCRLRRLERKKDRSDAERMELTSYIDAFVWPSYLKHGVHAMDTLKRELVGTETTNGTKKDVDGSKLYSSVLLRISNSDGASLQANSKTISNQIYNILCS